MNAPIHLSRLDARRIAIRAQLLDAPPPTDLFDVIRQLTFVQVEPTAAIAPTADLVLWSRLGAAYDPADLESEQLMELDLTIRPMEDLSLFKAEMALWPPHERTERWLDDNESFRVDILEQLETEGPLVAKEIPDSSIVTWSSSGWNNNRNVIMMLENLAKRGEIGVAGRRGRDRLWDLAERVYHSDIPTVPRAEAARIRNERRLRALGLAPVHTPDMPTETTRVGSAGVAATVEGVSSEYRLDPSYLDGSFSGRTALLSPFDGLIRDRKRMAELFEFDYALEMYKPAAKRRWGFYALPILHGDRLVGKLDAATDRTTGRLVVHSIHEDIPFTPAVREGVQHELESLAAWLGVRLVL